MAMESAHLHNGFHVQLDYIRSDLVVGRLLAPGPGKLRTARLETVRRTRTSWWRKRYLVVVEFRVV